MYKKFLIIISKQDPAGMNIGNQLNQFRFNPMLNAMKNQASFDFYLVEDSVLYAENLSFEKISQYDFLIFASKHKSEKKEKTLCLHAPGNFKEANLGGADKKLSKTSSQFMKFLFEKMIQNAKEHELDKKYKVTLEATHHGPLVGIPCCFIEIGSTEFEWKDRQAGFVLAKAIRDAIEKFKPNPYNENAIAIGGPHYAPNFNIIQEKSNYAISHLIPQYVLPLTEEILNETIEKTQEDIDLAIVDYKGLGKKEERDAVIEILEKNYIRWKKTSDVKKEI